MVRVADVEGTIRVHRILMMKPEKKKPCVNTDRKMILKYVIKKVIYE
jgi:hypothetical protein